MTVAVMNARNLNNCNRETWKNSNGKFLFQASVSQLLKVYAYIPTIIIHNVISVKSTIVKVFTESIIEY